MALYLNINPYPLGLGNVSLEQLIGLAVRYGFGGIDLPVSALTSTADAEALGKVIQAAGLRWGLFNLPCDFLQVNEDQYQTGLTRLREIVPLARAAGCMRTYNHIWPGSNERDYAENEAWHIERITALRDILSEYGIMLGLEFIGPKTLQDVFRYPYLRTLGAATDLALWVGEGVGIVLDSFHWYCSNGTLEDIRTHLARVPLVNVHINDAQSGRSREEQMDLERALPMESGIIDLPGFLSVLREFDYDGPVIVEPFNPALNRFKTMKPEAVAAEVITRMRPYFPAT